VPLALLRIEDRPGAFSAFSSARHLANVALKVVLVARGHGVAGLLWSDVVSTAAFVLALAPLLRGRAAPAFSRELLRPVLAFGLPKVPHGVLVQALNLADRKILDLFVTRAEVGLYQMGYTFGAGVKFATSAFEPAWGPFVYAQSKQSDGPRTLAGMATLAFASFCFAGLGFAVLGPDLLVILTTNPAFDAATPVVPVIALAYVLHGLFLATSVGIGIARAAHYYPIVTAAAAAANIAANVLLIPRLGLMGAAWATVIAYAVMAALGAAFSRRVFPIPFEARRLVAVAGAGLAAFALARGASSAGLGLAGRAAAVALFPALAYAAVGPDDRRRLRAMVKRPGGDTP
jgi:O-antigen/teichoic acid export membrane protein